MNISGSFTHATYPNFTQLELLRPQLESWIGSRIQDTQKANVLVSVCLKEGSVLLSTLPFFSLENFSDWFCDIATHLKNPVVDVDRFIRLLPKNLRNEFKKPVGYNTRFYALKAFLTELSNAWSEVMDQESKTKATIEKTKLVMGIIYYTGCGRGHLRPAEGLKQFFEKKNYQIHLIKSDEFSSNLTSLRKHLRQLQPDILISTVAHHPHYSQLAYDLQVPFITVHTDFQICFGVKSTKSLKKADFFYENPTYVQHALPHLEMDTCQEIAKDYLSPENYQALIQNVGFPLRESFKRETDMVVIKELRNQIGIRAEERVILIMDSLNHASTCINVVKQLRSTTRSLSQPLCLIFVCNQPSSKDNLLRELSSISAHPDMRIIFDTTPTEEKIAKYMKITSRLAPIPGIMISKSGGSTSGEALEMGVYTLIIPCQPGTFENINQDYLVERDMGVLLDEVDPTSQIVKTLKWSGPKEAVYKPSLDWQTNIETLVATKITEFAIKKFWGVTISDELFIHLNSSQ